MPNKIYQQREAEITFKASGGSTLFTPTSVANANGRLSTRHDFGVAPKSNLYRWRAKTKMAATPTLKSLVKIYLVTWDDLTDADGDFGAVDATITAEDQLANAHHIGNIVIDEAGTNPQKASSLEAIEVASRYVSVIWWNATGAAFSSTAGDHQFTLVPVPLEAQ